VGTLDLPAGDGHLAHAAAATSGRRRCRFCRAPQSVLGQVCGVGEARGLTADDPDARPAVAAGRQLFDLPVVETGRRRAPVFSEDLGELAPTAKGSAENALEDGLFDHDGTNLLRPFAAASGRLILPA
jgi:hypothetical protein